MAVFLVLAPFPSKISFTNVHFPYKHRFSLQKYRSMKVDFPSYSVFRAFPVLQLLKNNQLKIILMPKRHILRWPTHSVPLHSQQPICLTIQARPGNLNGNPEEKLGARHLVTGINTPCPVTEHTGCSLPCLVQLSLTLLLQLHFQLG